MSRKYDPDPLQFPEIVGIRHLGPPATSGEVIGKACVHAPILKLVERQAKLDMVNETVEWVSEEKLVPSLQHAVVLVFN